MLTWNVNALISPREWHVTTKNVIYTMQSGGGGKLILWQEYHGENLE